MENVTALTVAGPAPSSKGTQECATEDQTLMSTTWQTDVRRKMSEEGRLSVWSG